jgi:para-aminobenzoate synthetase component 1
VLEPFTHFRNFLFTHSKNGSGFLNGSAMLLIAEEGTNAEETENIPDLSEGDWRYGFVSYDYKNRIEELQSKNPDAFEIPDIYFQKTQQIFRKEEGSWKNILGSDERPSAAVEELLKTLIAPPNESTSPLTLKARFTKSEYVHAVRGIQECIRHGEIYEMNFCQEFYAENATVDVASVFRRLQELSPAPFSALLRRNDTYLISSSPERFLKKTGSRLLSQPIKGTRRRGKEIEEDALLKQELLEDEKERAENVMIVDLVRNDLSRIAERGTVKVDELFGIYSFEQVHQMISTVSCILRPGTSFSDIIHATFPMGSMTGAPKVRAMELIEQYERSRRGLYAGAVGILSPDGDFDLSVVIRSILYDAARNYVSFTVGSAITHKSDPDAEYEECLLKAQGLLLALGATLE